MQEACGASDAACMQHCPLRRALMAGEGTVTLSKQTCDPMEARCSMSTNAGYVTEVSNEAVMPLMGNADFLCMSRSSAMQLSSPIIRWAAVS